ncbi:hypothetical protein C8R46DRAFT_1085726 [Mycena filopes]|nr:hypothetical protein C8R46DRAFT_1085726 [Mycena filopes]
MHSNASCQRRYDTISIRLIYAAIPTSLTLTCSRLVRKKPRNPMMLSIRLNVPTPDASDYTEYDSTRPPPYPSPPPDDAHARARPGARLPPPSRIRPVLSVASDASASPPLSADDHMPVDMRAPSSLTFGSRSSSGSVDDGEALRAHGLPPVFVRGPCAESVVAPS